MLEAGYDYQLVRARLHQRFIRVSALLLVITGAVLVAAGTAYYIYAYKARSELGKFEFATTNLAEPGFFEETPASAQSVVATTAPEAIPTLPIVLRDFEAVSTDPEPASELPAVAKPEPVTDAVTAVTKLEVEVEVPGAAPAQPGPLISASALESQQAYPAGAIKSTGWSNPLEYEPTSFVEAALIKSFRPISASEGAAIGTAPLPGRLIIPGIGVDSKVAGLSIMDLGDSRAYETPKYVVGYLPETSSPGEKGSAWLFGHLESPLAGEGNVFYDLPKIPGLLRRGEVVYAIVESGTTSYLYQLTEAFVVHQDQLTTDYLRLQQLKPEFAHLSPGNANLHMVACVPRFVYDHRLVVSGVLVGIKNVPS